jgi:protein TonB
METLFNKTYCDAISDKRNKAFGQYELRVTYSERLFRAQFIALFAFSASIGLALWLSPEIKATENQKMEDPVIFRDVDVVLDVFEKVSPPEPPAPKSVDPVEIKNPDPVVEGTPLIKPEIVDENVEVKIDTLAVSTRSDDKNFNEPTVGTFGDGSGKTDGTINGSGDSKTQGTGDIGTGSVENSTFDIAEKEPVFEGNLESFILNATRYPGKAVENGIEGKVFVCFIVDESGKVTKPEVLKGIGYGCDEEAIRVVSSLPRWKPGENNGKPVKVRMRIPFKFYLKK